MGGCGGGMEYYNGREEFKMPKMPEKVGYGKFKVNTNHVLIGLAVLAVAFFLLKNKKLLKFRK